MGKGGKGQVRGGFQDVLTVVGAQQLRNWYRSLGRDFRTGRFLMKQNSQNRNLRHLAAGLVEPLLCSFGHCIGQKTIVQPTLAMAYWTELSVRFFYLSVYISRAFIRRRKLETIQTNLSIKIASCFLWKSGFLCFYLVSLFLFLSCVCTFLLNLYSSGVPPISSRTNFCENFLNRN